MVKSVIQFAPDAESRAWAQAAQQAAQNILSDSAARAAELRHANTWFVGLDVLPNAPDGALGPVPFPKSWRAQLPHGGLLHRAQVSVVFPGYPGRDPGTSEANHRYRMIRCAAHVDGLLPIGPERRRFPREFHAYVLGVHLDDCSAAPTVYWEGSHEIVGDALRAAIGRRAPQDVDVTEAYHAARREVFERCERRALHGPPGAAFLLHRFTLHGTQPWAGVHDAGARRMIAFFRPEFPDARTWLDRP